MTTIETFGQAQAYLVIYFTDEAVDAVTVDIDINLSFAVSQDFSVLTGLPTDRGNSGWIKLTTAIGGFITMDTFYSNIDTRLELFNDSFGSITTGDSSSETIYNPPLADDGSQWAVIYKYKILPGTYYIKFDCWSDDLTPYTYFPAKFNFYFIANGNVINAQAMALIDSPIKAMLAQANARILPTIGFVANAIADGLTHYIVFNDPSRWTVSYAKPYDALYNIAESAFSPQFDWGQNTNDFVDGPQTEDSATTDLGPAIRMGDYDSPRFTPNFNYENISYEFFVRKPAIWYAPNERNSIFGWNSARIPEFGMNFAENSYNAGSQMIVIRRDPAVAEYSYANLGTPELNTWYHIVITISPTGIVKTYLNGILKATFVHGIQGGTYGSTSYLRNYYAPYNMDLSNLLIYNSTELTADQVYSHYVSVFPANNHGQAMATILTTRPTAYAEGYISSYDQPVHSQSQAFIRKSAGYANARARIDFSPGDYGYVVQQDGATSYWPMDSTASGTDFIDDQTLLLQFGTVSGAGINPTQRLSQRTSSNGYYLITSGTPQRFRGPQWSVDGWARFSVATQRQPVFGILSTITNYISVGQGSEITAGSAGNSIVVYHRFENVNQIYSSSVTIALNTWYHFALTQDDGVFTLYVNGVQTIQWTAPPMIASQFSFWRDPFFGTGTSTSPYLDGMAAYDTILTPEQIMNHAIAGKLQAYGQARAQIGTFQYAQATFYIFNSDPGATNIWQEKGQAQASILKFNIRAHAQAKARIKAENLKFAQTQAWILPTTDVAQAQAKINSFDYNQYGQAQTHIKTFDLSNFAQAQTYIGHFQFAQAIAQIMPDLPEGYRKTVLESRPIIYYPMDEASYGTGVLESIVGRNRDAIFNASGAVFGENSPANAGTSIDFNGRYAESQVPLGGIEQGAMTFPGIAQNGSNRMTPYFYAEAGTVIEVTITQACNGNIGINSWENGENPWWGYCGYQCGSGSIGVGVYYLTIPYTGMHWLYTWPQSVGRTGAGSYRLIGQNADSYFPEGDEGPITIEFWMKPQSQDKMIFGFWEYDLIYSIASGGKLGFNTGGGDVYGVVTGDIAGQWTHVAAVIYGGGVVPSSTANKIYINGVLQTLSGTGGNAQFVQLSPKFRIGLWRVSTGYEWDGSLDEFAIFDRELPPEEILAHYSSIKGLMSGNAQAYISPAFNQPVFGQAQALILVFDVSRFGQAQTFIGSFKFAQAVTRIEETGLYAREVSNDLPTWWHRLQDLSGTSIVNQISIVRGTSSAGGITYQLASPIISESSVAKAISTSGGGQIESNLDQHVDTFSIEIWAKPNLTIQVDTEGSNAGTPGTSGERYLWYPIQEGSSSGIGVAMGTNAISVYEHGDAWMPAMLVYEGSFIEWTHVVVTIESNTIRLYVNGELVRTTAASGRTLYSPTGYLYGPYGNFSGSVAEAAIYSTKLNDVRILAHYMAHGFVATGQAQAEMLESPYIQVYGQSQALIVTKAFVFAQALVQIKSIDFPQIGQALAFIGHFQWAQAAAQIKAIGVVGVGQALTFIGHFQTGLAQARLRTFDVEGFGQAVAQIVKSAGYGNTQATIKATVSSIGYTQAWILPTTNRGNVQAWIKQTYPLVTIETNWALASLGAIATDSLEQIVEPYYTIDGEDYGFRWSIAGIALDQYLQINFGQGRAVDYYRILPVTYDATVSIQVNIASFPGHYSWQTVATGIQFNVGFYEDLDTSRIAVGTLDTYVSEYGTNITNAIRIVITDDGANNGVSLSTVELGQAVVRSPTFAQAQAFLGHFGVAQVQAYVSPGFGIAHGQVKAQIMETFTRRGQAKAFIIAPTVVSNALGTILQTYYAFGQVPSWVIPPTVIANAQATIKAYDVEGLGQALADIEQTYSRIANAKAMIHKAGGWAQVQAIIKSGRTKVHGQARAKVGNIHTAYAMAYIIKAQGYGQAKVSIKDTKQRFAQAAAQIKQLKGYSNAQAQIKQTYVQYGLAVAIMNQTFALGQAQVNIEQTYSVYGQANARLKNLATNYSNPYGSSQAMIYIRYYTQAQAQAWITVQNNANSQAMAFIGPIQIAQAQALIFTTDYPRFGQAAGYVLASSIVTPPGGPTSEAHTYLIRYNDYDLPGYAQSESYDSVVSLVTNYAVSIDGGLSEYTGLTNKAISLTMRTWEPTYNEVKAKVDKAATLLRSSKGFAKLYVQQSDAYFLALVRSIHTEKAVRESVRTLDYTVEFEAKPWLISNDTYEISGTGAISTQNRTFYDGGWTPTVIIVSGTDVEITATTATGDPAGHIQIDGECIDLVIDSEAFTAIQAGVNRNDLVLTKDYAIYVGPGTTNFQIDGATSCVIQYHNRWYLASNKGISTQPIATTPVPVTLITQGIGQARVAITSSIVQGFAQGRALIRDADKKIGLANALIHSPITNAHAQSRAYLRNGRSWANAQAKATIHVADTEGLGQSMALIEGITKYKVSQARATIRQHRKIGTGLARAKIQTVPPAPSSLIATSGDEEVIITWV